MKRSPPLDFAKIISKRSPSRKEAHGLPFKKVNNKRLLQQPALGALTCVWTLLIDCRFESNDVSLQSKSLGRINKKKKAKKHQYPTFPD